MFDDLIKKKAIKKIQANDTECPVCGSGNVYPSFGTFSSGSTYIQMITCKECGAIWSIVFDEDLNIIDSIIS